MRAETTSEGRVRALLLRNPNATSADPAVAAEVTTLLSAEVKLDVEVTERREHASLLAADAVSAGYEVVIALGGDGTVNEVVQGLAGTAVKLAVIPSGGTNVWARALGMPRDPLQAASAILGSLRDSADRRVSLGRANGRWFTFSAGYGYDAAVVDLVEQRRRLGRRVGPATFVWCGLLARPRMRRAAITVACWTPEGHQQVVGRFRAAAACNCDPYTYLWRWPVRLCPSASLDRDLDLTAVDDLALPLLLRIVPTAVSGARAPALAGVQGWHDHPGYTLTSPVPLPVHVDGEVLRPTTRLELRSISQALTVVA